MRKAGREPAAFSSGQRVVYPRALSITPLALKCELCPLSLEGNKRNEHSKEGKVSCCDRCLLELAFRTPHRCGGFPASVSQMQTFGT